MAGAQALVRQHFEREAFLWRDIYQSGMVESAVYQARQDTVLAMVDQLGLSPDARILELGCGAGWNVAALASRGYPVYAVDLVDEMLQTARITAPKAKVLSADAQALPFASGKFDVVVAIALVEWLSTPRLFSEIARVLAPGGHAILTATNRWSLQRCLDPYLHPMIEPLKSALRCATPDRAHSRTHSLSQLDKAFAAAGLQRRAAVTAGFGPFTFMKRKLLPGPRGARLHDALQRHRLLRRAGYAHVVMAQKGTR